MKLSSIECGAVAALAAIAVVTTASAQSVPPPAVPHLGSPLRVVPSHAAPDGAVMVRLHQDRLAAIAACAEPAFVLDAVPLAPGVQRALLLRRVDGLDLPLVQLVEDGPMGGTITRALEPDEVRASQGIMLAGISLGAPDSRAFLSFGPSGVFGIVDEGDRRFIISSGRHGANQPILAFDPMLVPRELLPVLDWSCEAETVEPCEPSEPNGGLASQPCRQFRIAIETDHEYCQLFGCDPLAAANYAQLLLAASTEIYLEALNARLGPTFLRLWLTPDDPWTATTPSAQLQAFRTHWNQSMTSVPRDVAHFLSGRQLGGGVAWTGTVCGPNSFSLSSNINGALPYPLVDHDPQNWDIIVVSHEIGHNLGSLHTHQYGMESPDSCFWGDCSGAWGGTIMSYCFICPGGMANMVLHFAQPCVDSMVTKLESVACDFAPPFANPVAVVDFATVRSGGFVSIPVLANDADANCDAIQLAGFTAVSGAGGIISVGSSSGHLVYKPPAGFVGMDSFGYVIVGSSPAVGIGEVQIQVSTILGDLDGDGRVAGSDLGILMGVWGATQHPVDLDGDGIIDGSDLVVLIGNWTG